MIAPTVPHWFRRMLKEFDPSLQTRFNFGTKKWDICYPRDTLKNHGDWEGHQIKTLETVMIPFMSVECVGSRIIRDLRERRMGRFENYIDFCRKMKVRYE